MCLKRILDRSWILLRGAEPADTRCPADGGHDAL